MAQKRAVKSSKKSKSLKAGKKLAKTKTLKPAASFLKLDGIDGESTSSGHTGWIEV